LVSDFDFQGQTAAAPLQKKFKHFIRQNQTFLKSLRSRQQAESVSEPLCFAQGSC
jgi:hypothetical protein